VFKVRRSLGKKLQGNEKQKYKKGGKGACYTMKKQRGVRGEDF